MARLLGKQTGATIVEVHGPQAGRNYFADGITTTLVAPVVHIQVFGSGSVQLEQNLSHIHVGERASNIGGQGPINTEMFADPATWAPVGVAVAETDGIQARTLTVGNPDPTFVRLIVVTPGDGWVHFEQRWD